MDRTQQVLQRLKTKVSALGFNQRELKGIAARIADNLDSAEDAPDESLSARYQECREDIHPQKGSPQVPKTYNLLMVSKLSAFKSWVPRLLGSKINAFNIYLT